MLLLLVVAVSHLVGVSPPQAKGMAAALWPDLNCLLLQGWVVAATLHLLLQG